MIEQGFGQTKRRFHCLFEKLRISPKKACLTFIACAVLHNICKDLGMPDFPEEDGFEDPNNIHVEYAALGFHDEDGAMRAHITAEYFQ